MPKSKAELTEAEWAIIKAVWEHEPCAAPAIQEALHKSREWTYSTVRTLMDRMVAKRLLTAEKIRNLTLYRSAVTRAEAQKGDSALRAEFGDRLPVVLLDGREHSYWEVDEPRLRKDLANR